MYSAFELGLKYLNYYLSASNGKGHGVHSPFVFDFITNVLNDKRHFYHYDTIEYIRNSRKEDNRVLTIEDYGAGSVVSNSKQRKVSSIAKSALKPKKFGQLMFRMVNYYGPEVVVELGTSLGITTSYLAAANDLGHVFTFEGAKEVAAIARENFEKLSLKNISVVQGNFDETLEKQLKVLQHVDLAFVDGNHRKEPTLNYFHQLLEKKTDHSVFIFDDIHWSKNMEEAWKQIQQHPDVTLTIDLFFIGLVFFRKEQRVPQHFAIRF